MTDYLQKLKDPRWQKRRLEILERDLWCCQICYDGEATLHVHHMGYFPQTEPWDIHEKYLITLCDSCHENESVEIKEAEQRLLLSLKSCGYLAFAMTGLAEVFEHLSEEQAVAGFARHTVEPQREDILYCIKNYKELASLIQRLTEVAPK